MGWSSSGVSLIGTSPWATPAYLDNFSVDATDDTPRVDGVFTDDETLTSCGWELVDVVDEAGGVAGLVPLSGAKQRYG